MTPIGKAFYKQREYYIILEEGEFLFLKDIKNHKTKWVHKDLLKVLPLNDN